MIRELNFKDGILDGLPIGLGYLSVSFGFGVMAKSMGFSVLQSVIISGTNLASAGQVAGITIISACGTLVEIILAMLVINLRYSLMALTLTQKLDSSFNTPMRALCAVFITDEIFAVSSSKPRINTKYFLGLALLPYIGWTGGTLLGAVAGEILPSSISSALGIAIYGMFIAIFVPPARKFSGALIAVIIASLLSCIIKYTPFLSFISDGFSIIICAVVAAAAAAKLKPIFADVEEPSANQDGGDDKK